MQKVSCEDLQKDLAEKTLLNLVSNFSWFFVYGQLQFYASSRTV